MEFGEMVPTLNPEELSEELDRTIAYSHFFKFNEALIRAQNKGHSKSSMASMLNLSKNQFEQRYVKVKLYAYFRLANGPFWFPQEIIKLIPCLQLDKDKEVIFHHFQFCFEELFPKCFDAMLGTYLRAYLDPKMTALYHTLREIAAGVDLRVENEVRIFLELTEDWPKLFYEP